MRRRAFLLGGGAAAAGVTVGVGAAELGAADIASKDSVAATASRVPYTGPHQPAISATPVARLASLAAFDVVAPDRSSLAGLMTDLSRTVSDLMAGRLPPPRDASYPPLETGVLGTRIRPDHLGIVVSVGAGLFDDRFGLADRRPSGLQLMPILANDELDSTRTHGDLLVSIEADHEDQIQHALRQIMRATRSGLVLKWTTQGYARGVGAVETETPRNLMGFKDGTANLDLTDDALMDRHVWVGPDDGEPQWAVGGSYVAVRVIRMFVEFWDRTRLDEQEKLIGRHKVSGAPLGAAREFAPVSFAADPAGEVTPLDSHIRLANPRTAETQDDLMLRRGFSYSRGVDRAGLLDQGLAFVSYQRDMDRFLRVQARLAGEPLEEYTRPEGGGFFFALPGVADASVSLADRMLADVS